MKEAAEAIKKSGKVKFVGFSTHDPPGGATSERRGGRLRRRHHDRKQPLAGQGSPDHRALDACHKAGIGLVSMKQIAGQTTAQ